MTTDNASLVRTRGPGVARYRDRVRSIDGILVPQVIMTVPVLVSFAAWALPGSGLDRGYSVRANLTGGALVVLVSWLALMLVVTTVGHVIGSAVRPPRALADIDERRAANVVTVIASIGVLYSYFLVFSSVSVGAVLSARTGNDLSAVLPDSPGLQTLRYAAAASMAMATYGYIQGDRRRLFLLWNAGLLLSTVLLASRLSIVLCALLVVFLFRHKITFTWGRLAALALLGAIGLFAVTLPFNYVRNANYYEARGISNPIMMNVSQLVAYLGTPAQVAIGTASAAYDGTLGSGFRSGLDFALPTYLQPGYESTSVSAYGMYAPSVDVAGNFTTNSAFADTLSSAGVGGLVAITFGAFVASFLIGSLRQYRNSAALLAGMLLYGLAEWWRIYILNAGIIHFVFLSVLLACIVSRTRHRTVSGLVPDGS
jgi:hypothetical protein